MWGGDSGSDSGGDGGAGALTGTGGGGGAGLGLGTNSMAGLVTRGCLEMNTLARAMGAPVLARLRERPPHLAWPWPSQAP